MKLKLISVIALVALVFMGSVLWRTDRFVYGDRMSWVEAQTRTQTSSINNSVASELRGLQRVIGQVGLEGLQKNKSAWVGVAPYFAAANVNVINGEFQPQTMAAKENSKAATWSLDFVKSALGKAPANVGTLRFFVKPFQDTQRGRYVAVVFLEGSRGTALFGSGESFQSLIDAQRGSFGNFSIVTTTGLTVSHSIPEYLGTVMKDDPLFQQAQKGAASQGGQTLKTANGEDLYGLYEEVPRSNLWVMSTTTLKEVMKGRLSLTWQFALLAAGLLLVGVAGILYVVIPAEKEKENLAERVAQMQNQARLTSSGGERKVTAEDPEKTKKESLEASVRVASALAHEMRGPMTAIMGYSQMIMAQGPSDEITKSTESIQRETRAARDVLDKLLGYAGENEQEKLNLKVDGPLAKALKPLDPLFQQKGIKLVRNLGETIPLDIQVESLTKALTHIFMNSVEAMERMPRKEITIDLFEDAEGIHLNIADTGEGIEAANLERIFDPFFTTRSHRQQMGLGLSLAYGILKEHGATLKVESERSKGTKIMITFVKPEVPSVLSAPKKEEVVVAPELPQLKKDSVHMEEARQVYVASQPEEAKPASPLNVNIDKLLEFPDSGSDELEFIDGFIDNKKPKNAAPAPSANDERTVVLVNSDPLQIPEEVLAGPVDQPDQELSSKIQPPKASSRAKTSKLDAFHVEIRRPGKRI